LFEIACGFSGLLRERLPVLLIFAGKRQNREDEIERCLGWTMTTDAQTGACL
jgi:hypothetical protein